MNEIETQLCPYCSEEIKFQARKCKHCNEWLDQNVNNESNQNQDEDNESNQNQDEDNESWQESLYYIIGNVVFHFLLYAWAGAQGFAIAMKIFWPKTADFFEIPWIINPFTFIPDFLKSFFS